MYLKPLISRSFFLNLIFFFHDFSARSIQIRFWMVVVVIVVAGNGITSSLVGMPLSWRLGYLGGCLSDMK